MFRDAGGGGWADTRIGHIMKPDKNFLAGYEVAENRGIFLPDSPWEWLRGWHSGNDYNRPKSSDNSSLYWTNWDAGWNAKRHHQPYDESQTIGWRDGWARLHVETTGMQMWTANHPAEAEIRRKTEEDARYSNFDPAFGYTESEFFGGENS